MLQLGTWLNEDSLVLLVLQVRITHEGRLDVDDRLLRPATHRESVACHGPLGLVVESHDLSNSDKVII